MAAKPKIINTYWGVEARRRRDELGLTVAQLAKEAGVTPKAIYDNEARTAAPQRIQQGGVRIAQVLSRVPDPMPLTEMTETHLREIVGQAVRAAILELGSK